MIMYNMTSDIIISAGVCISVGYSPVMVFHINYSIVVFSVQILSCCTDGFINYPLYDVTPVTLPVQMKISLCYAHLQRSVEYFKHNKLLF